VDEFTAAAELDRGSWYGTYGIALVVLALIVLAVFGRSLRRS